MKAYEIDNSLNYSPNECIMGDISSACENKCFTFTTFNNILSAFAIIVCLLLNFLCILCHAEYM